MQVTKNFRFIEISEDIPSLQGIGPTKGATPPTRAVKVDGAPFFVLFILFESEGLVLPDSIPEKKK